MQIHYFSSEPWEEEYVKSKLTGDQITFHDKPLGAYPDLTDPSAEALCLFIDSPIGAAELDRFPAVKLIATRSTGYDHMDLATAKARGITVVTVPFYGENTVAEFAFALLLALSRRIPEARAQVLSMDAFSPNGLRGFDLEGKTIGIVGTGHIGAHMIRMAKGFGMRVIAFDAFPNAELSHTLDFPYLSLSELLSASDVVSLHVPYNDKTHHLINRDNISEFKKGAYLINTARGAVIETAALVDALTQGIIAGAGLDVLEEEQSLQNKTSEMSVENHYLINHAHVIVTPHCAFNTMEAVTRIIDTTVDNIQKFAAGTPANVVP